MEKHYIQNVRWLYEGSADATPEHLKKTPRPYIKRDAHGRFRKYMNTVRVSNNTIDFIIGLYVVFLIAIYFIAKHV